MSKLEGFLFKQGQGLGKVRLKKRWFVLKGDQLHYYKPSENTDTTKSLGYIDVGDIVSVQRVATTNNKRESFIGKRGTRGLDADTYPFDVVTNDRVYHLVAATAKDQQMWLNGLTDAVVVYKGGTPRRPIVTDKVSKTAQKNTTKIHKQVNDLSAARNQPTKPVVKNDGDLMREKMRQRQNRQNDTPSSKPSSSSSRAHKSFNTSKLDQLLARLKELIDTPADVIDDAPLDRILDPLREVLATERQVKQELEEIRNLSKGIVDIKNLSEQELNTLAQLQKAVEDMKKRMTIRRNTHADRTICLEKIKRIYDKLVAEYDVFKQLTEEIDDIKAKLRAIDLAPLTREVKDLRNQADQLPKKLAELDKKIKEVSNKLRKIGQEKQDLQSQLTTLPTEKDRIQDKESDINNRLAEIEARIKELEAKRAELMEELEKLKARKSSLAKREKMVAFLKNIMEDSSWDDLMGAFQMVSTLEKQAESVMQDLDAIDDEFDDDLGDDQVIKRKQAAIKRKVQLFEDSIEKERRDIKETEDRVNHALAQVDDELARLKREKEDLLRQLSELADKRVAIEKKAAAAENRIAQIEQEQKQLNNALDDLKRERDKLQQEIANVEKKLDKKSGVLQTEKHRKEKLEVDLEALQNKRDDTINRLEELIKEALSLLDSQEQLKKELSKLNSLLERIQQDISQIKTNRTNTMESKKKSIDQLKTQLTNMLDDVYVRLGLKRIGIMSTKDATREFVQDNSAEKDEEIYQLQREVRNSNKQVEEKDRQISNIKTDLEEQQSKVSSLYTTIEDLEAKIKKLSEENRELSTKKKYGSDSDDDLSYDNPYSQLSKPSNNNNYSTSSVSDEELREKERQLDKCKQQLDEEKEDKLSLYKQIKGLKLDLSKKNGEIEQLKLDVIQAQSASMASREYGSSPSRSIKTDSSYSSSPPVKTMYSPDTINTLEKELQSKENLVVELTQNYQAAQSKLKVCESDLNVAHFRVQQQTEELRAKDGHILQLSNQLKSGNAPQQRRGNDEVEMLRHELTKQRAAMQAHQSQNAQLDFEIRRLQSQNESLRKAKEYAIKDMQRQMQSFRDENQSIRHRMLTDGSIEKNIVEELEHIKQEYFFSIAVGIKLNLSMKGETCNLNVAQLYEQAKDTVPYKQWNSWVTQQFMHAAKAEASNFPRSPFRDGSDRANQRMPSGDKKDSLYPLRKEHDLDNSNKSNNDDDFLSSLEELTFDDPSKGSSGGGDPRMMQQGGRGGDPRAGGDPRMMQQGGRGDPRGGRGGDPRMGGRGGDPRGGDPRMGGRGGDPRGGDPRMGGRGGDPRAGRGDPRMMQQGGRGDPRGGRGGDPRMMGGRGGDPRAGDPRMGGRGGDPRGGDPRMMQQGGRGDPRMMGGRGGDPRMGGDPRGGDPRMMQHSPNGRGGDPRMMGGRGDPRMMQQGGRGGDPRMMGGRGGDPRMMQQSPNGRGGDPRMGGGSGGRGRGDPRRNNLDDF